MDFRALKDLAKKVGGLLVFDGNEPSFVVLPYDKFKKLDNSEEIPVLHRNGLSGVNETDIADGADDDDMTVEKLNREILALKEEIRQKEEAELIENDQQTAAVAEAIDPD